MPGTGYEPFEAPAHFFEVVMGGLRGIGDGKPILIPSPKTQPLSPGITSPVGL